jgi:hypothetical protein
VQGSGSRRGEVEVDGEELGAAADLGEAPGVAGLPWAPTDLSSRFELLRRLLVKLIGGCCSVKGGECLV